MTRGAAVGLMVLAPLLWSSAGVVTRHVERADPIEQVFWRSFFAFLFVAVFLFFRSNPLKAVIKAGGAGLFSGAMWAVMFTAFVIALSLTTTANALVAMSISPLLTVIAARIVLSDPIPLRTWIAAIAAAAGIAWMFSEGTSANEATHVAGMLVALIIPVASALNLVALRARGARVDFIPAVMLGGALSSLIALPLALPLSASATDVLLLGSLGVFQLGLPCVLLVMASRALLAPELALLGLLEVVLGPLWAWLGAGEAPAAATLSGGAVVIAALAGNELAALYRNKKGSEQFS